MSYSTKAGFETFPFPKDLGDLVEIGDRYLQHRQTIMLTRQQGMTTTYNRFHDQGEQAEDIARLRALHVEMDHALAAAYGWSDLDLGHGFHETRQSVRFTLSGSARRIVLDRLLALNNERYEEETRAGLHNKKPKRVSSKRGSGNTKVEESTAQGQLL